MDAESLISTSPLMPTKAYEICDKLSGFSVAVDVFHGINHPIATNVRNFVLAVCPMVHRCAEMMGDTPAKGIEFLIRCLYEVQQDYSYYVNQLAAGNQAVAVPDFTKITRAIETQRDGDISSLPANYQLLIKAPASNDSNKKQARGNNSGSNSTSGNNSSDRAGLQVVHNAHADSGLRTRFANSGAATISALMNGHEVEIPKHAGNEVCLTWAIKGQCTRACHHSRSPWDAILLWSPSSAAVIVPSDNCSPTAQAGSPDTTPFTPSIHLRHTSTSRHFT